jgi:hypothetical protein
VLRVSVCLFVKPATRVKTDNLFPVDIDKLEQGFVHPQTAPSRLGGVGGVTPPKKSQC